MNMDSDELEMLKAGEIQTACGVQKAQAKRITELEALNKRFFSAGFSQGYGAELGAIHRVDELYEKTKACLDNS